MENSKSSHSSSTNNTHTTTPIPIPINKSNNSSSNSSYDNNKNNNRNSVNDNKISTSAPNINKTTKIGSISSSGAIGIKKSTPSHSIGGGGLSIFSSVGQRMRMSYSPSNSVTTSTTTTPTTTTTGLRDKISLSTSSGSSHSGGSSSSSYQSYNGGFLKPSISNTSLSSLPHSSSSPFSPIPSPRGLYVKPSNINTSSGTNISSSGISGTSETSSTSYNSLNSSSPLSSSPSIFLKPSPSNSIHPIHTFLKPYPPQTTNIFNSTPKTTTIGFSVPTEPQPQQSQGLLTNSSDFPDDNLLSTTESGDLDFGFNDDSSSDSEHLGEGEEDYEVIKEYEDDDDEVLSDYEDEEQIEVSESESEESIGGVQEDQEMESDKIQDTNSKEGEELSTTTPSTIKIDKVPTRSKSKLTTTNSSKSKTKSKSKSKRKKKSKKKPTTTTTTTTPSVNNNNNSNSKNTKKEEEKFYVNIESLTPTQIEKMVLEGWNDNIPRYQQKEACTLILQNILELYKKAKESPPPPQQVLSDKDIFKIPKIKSEFLSESNNQIIPTTTTTTTTTTSSSSTSNSKKSNSTYKPGEHSARNYLIQHAAGSGKSLTIACLVYNLYRLLENGKKKYDLILILNDRRHLDTQLGSIVTKFLKDNDMTSIHHPGTVASLDKILMKAKTRVVVTTMQKFTNLIDKPGQFDRISKKYKSIALISDEAHRSHGKSMSRNIHSILTGDTRQNSNITYFCFTCTPTARCLEMFGETKGNLKVPFHCYSLEKALQDKVVMSVIDNYTTVSILTKISANNPNNNPNNNNNNNNNNQEIKGKKTTTTKFPTVKKEPNTSAMNTSVGLYNEKRTSYHLLKNAQSDRKIIQEKASYIIKHFVKIRELANNSEFKGRAMLVTSNRNQILTYKVILESLIKKLPKEQRFDIIATFSPFIYRKKVKMDSDQKINGQYSKYFKKRDGISDILRKDEKKYNVQLIIVADKLQTGFDEPSLNVMYVDKTLKGANAVQTLGRLSRCAKGKKASYVVDFVNSRKDISDSFSQYWRETQLKGATRKTVLEIKLNRLFNKLNDIDPLSNGKLMEGVDYILKDDERRKKEKKYGSITDDITHFVELCNQLFWDNTNSPMNIKFLESVKFAVCQTRLKSQMTSIRGLLMNIENKSTLLGSSTSSIQPSSENTPLTNTKFKPGKYKPSNGMNTHDNIISSINKQEEYRAMDMFRTNQIINTTIKQESLGDSMDLDAENLDFAREMWSSNPEFKLRTSLLTPTSAKEDLRDDHINDIGFDPKDLDHVETIDQVIEVVVEFVSRNGTTFENFIQNQSLAQIFPFIDPMNPNHSIYKSKLEKARFSRFQEHILQQQQQQHQQLLQQQYHQHQHQQKSKDTDIIMYDSSVAMASASNSVPLMPLNQPNVSAPSSLRSSLNNSASHIQNDIPLPVALPVVNPESVVGKPHSEGRLDDCLLDDCILSFCHDLDSKDSSLKVYAIQTLTTLAGKGIHKNNLHEIVGSINKILMNRQENISLKMIALELLGIVALHDETTINQIIENNVIQTVLKLIQSAEEPLKAKSCRFLAFLCSETTILTNIMENNGIVQIVACLDSYDYYVTEHALRLLIALTQEDRTVKVIRSSIDPNVWQRLDHHKIHQIHELSQQLKTIISGTKRSLSQFQPSINTKRIRSSLLTKSN